MSPIFILIVNGRINGDTHGIAHRTFSCRGNTENYEHSLKQDCSAQ